MAALEEIPLTGRVRLRQFIPLMATLGAFALLVGWPFRFPVDTAFWHRLMDAAHLPLFLGLTLVLHHTLRGWNRPFRHPKRITAGVCAFLAVAVEWLQPLIGREASSHDLINGLLGIAIGITGLTVNMFRSNLKPTPHPPFRHPLPSSDEGRGQGVRGETLAGRLTTQFGTIPIRVLWTLLSLTAVLYVTRPAWHEWQAIRWRTANFPMLGDFENAIELRLWTPQGGSAAHPTQVSRSTQFASHGQHSLEVRLGDTDWPGVNFNAGELDFSKHASLRFDLYNPGAPFGLVLRVDDDGDCSSNDSRYVRGFTLTNGWNHVSVPVTELESQPKARRLNVRAVRRLVLFNEGEAVPPSFSLDGVRLE